MGCGSTSSLKPVSPPDGIKSVLPAVPQDVVLGIPGAKHLPKEEKELNITLERLFQFERVTFDHLTIPSIVNRKRVSQTTSTSDIPHTKKMAQNQTLTRRF